MYPALPVKPLLQRDRLLVRYVHPELILIQRALPLAPRVLRVNTRLLLKAQVVRLVRAELMLIKQLKHIVLLVPRVNIRVRKVNPVAVPVKPAHSKIKQVQQNAPSALQVNIPQVRLNLVVQNAKQANIKISRVKRLVHPARRVNIRIKPVKHNAIYVPPGHFRRPQHLQAVPCVLQGNMHQIPAKAHVQLVLWERIQTWVKKSSVQRNALSAPSVNSNI